MPGSPSIAGIDPAVDPGISPTARTATPRALAPTEPTAPRPVPAPDPSLDPQPRAGVPAEALGGESGSSHDDGAQGSTGAPVTEVSPPKRLPSPPANELGRESSETAND
jgi:hypothetical protein